MITLLWLQLHPVSYAYNWHNFLQNVSLKCSLFFSVDLVLFTRCWPIVWVFSERNNKSAKLFVSQPLRCHVLDICFPLIKPRRPEENRAWLGINEAKKVWGSAESFLERCPWDEFGIQSRCDATRLSIQTINFNHNHRLLPFFLVCCRNMVQTCG